MQCPCGDETRLSTHEVKTMQKALEWSSRVLADQMPVKIVQERCRECGRMIVWVLCNNGSIIEKRG